MRGLFLAIVATAVAGCGQVQDAQVVGRWTAVKTDLRAGTGVTIDMDIRADKTVELTFKSDVPGVWDSSKGTWKPSGHRTIELTLTEDGETVTETGTLLNANTLEVDEGVEKFQFTRAGH